MPSVLDLVAQIEERQIRARIKQARLEAGLTQEQIAELIGVRDRTYWNYEREDEKGRTPWHAMNAIAAATGKSQEWLLHGTAPDVMAALNGPVDPNALAAQIISEVKAELRPDLPASKAIFNRLDAIDAALDQLRERSDLRHAELLAAVADLATQQKRERGDEPGEATGN